MICTLYSHYTGFDNILQILTKKYPKATQTRGKEDEFHTVDLEIKGGLFGSPSKIKVAYRERQKPSYRLLHEDVCPLSNNLKGLYGFVSSLPTSNEEIKGRLLQKITTMNCEFSVIQEAGQTKDLKELIHTIAQDFDAFLFAQPGTVISRSNGQHLLNKDLQLIIDGQGNCEIAELVINVDAKYYDKEQPPVLADQRARRQKSELVCAEHNVPVYKNPDALFVESDTTVKIRTKDDVVDRAIALCYMEVISEKPDAMLLANVARKYNLQAKVTPRERQFADNPNPSSDDIANANWRAESFHTLLWALSFIDDLKYPGDICNVSEDVRHLFSRTEQEFRDAAKLRSKEEILDQADLILRLNWACVGARVKNLPPPGELNPSVVYERHYALNWLIHSLNQEWDKVTTNT